LGSAGLPVHFRRVNPSLAFPGKFSSFNYLDGLIWTKFLVFMILTLSRVDGKTGNQKAALWAALFFSTFYFHSNKLDPFTTPSWINFLANGMKGLQSIFGQGY
jgi:hypothetical protein